MNSHAIYSVAIVLYNNKISIILKLEFVTFYFKYLFIYLFIVLSI